MGNAFYNDDQFSYLTYWQSRKYEHESELFALKKLLGKQHFPSSTDLGGGYGRLSVFLSSISDHVNLIEPSSKQRQLAKSYLKSYPNVAILPGSDLQTELPSDSQDLVILVRVIHHLSDTSQVFAEINRILKPEGTAVIEFANSLNFKSKLRSMFMNQIISKSPIDLRSAQNQNQHTILFSNHHPETILKSLHAHNLLPQSQLSVSNFRSPLLKKIIPLPILLFLEKIAQTLLSSLYYGPSIFVLVKKSSKLDNPKTP
jgi:ubiquinone/menaquinone biosynthesis C-methylase UbiE